jgi:uncharacterized GH25 family protein
VTHRVSRVMLAVALLLVCAVAAASAHDLFLRPRAFVVRPGSTVDVRVLNGTFTTSEAAVARERLRDLSVLGPAGRSRQERETWVPEATESRWRVTVGEPGTYVLGASLLPRTIRLSGSEFNGYLRDEGLPDILVSRTTARQLADSAHERYAKHVKALVRVQVGGSAARAPGDTAYRIPLGYPAELVPLDDPYALGAGGVLRVRALANGVPLTRHIVQAGGRAANGARIPLRQVRTDGEGIARVRLDRRGTWYVKFIDMRAIAVRTRDSVDYESSWATLTFARP